METIIIKMTDAYDYQPLFNTLTNTHILDCRDLEGTKCYLDDASKDTLIKRIAPYSAKGLHFIDSGNYHYLTLLWLSKIDYDFNLVLFDHHPDNQAPSFGAITSCGGWVLEAQENLPHLKNIFTYGVGDEVAYADLPSDLPIYISIDKDILSKDYAITDWDQGDMSLEELSDGLSVIFENHEIIGVDICGDSGEYADSGAKINNQINSILFDFVSKNS